MGIFRANKHKTLFKLNAAIFVLSAIIIPSVYLGKNASAATNLTFTWKDAQTITVSGTLNGDIAGSVATSGQFPYSGSVIATPSNLCNYLSTTVNLDNNTVTVDSKNVVESGVAGSVRCTSELLGITGSLPVGGIRSSTATETTDEQKANIYLASNLNKDASPPNVKFTLKNSSGKTIATLSVPKTFVALTNGSLGTGSAGTNYDVNYDHTFTLVPGTYSICFSAFDSCHNFIKVKYVATSESYGVRGSYNYINVLVSSDAPQAASANFTVAAQKITLSQSGKVLQTVTAPEYVHKAVINDQSGGGASVISVPQLAKFSNVSPGTYQICVVSTKACVTVNKVVDAVTIPDPVVISTAADVVSSDTNGSGSCEGSSITLGWIMCPIIMGLSNAVDGIYNNIIQPMLREDTSKANPALETAKLAWSGFRVYADIFLVIALLVVVFGQSIGGGLIDAYSAKKILPKLLLAVILINLSYYIVVLMLDITNVVGGGIVDLITKPFGAGASSFNLKLNGVTSTVALGSLTAGVVYAFAGGAAFLGWLWPFVLLPAILAIVATFITILIRRGLIILLIIFSPVAFALYILPNTEKYFRQWWDMLFKTLLVYPIIMVLFALSQIMGAVISSGGGSSLSAGVAGILSVVAIIVPLFLVPFAFKLAGGVIGQASQALNGLSKQAHKKILGDPRDTNSMGAKAKNRLGEKYADKNMTGRAVGARLNPATMFGDKRRQQRKDNLAVIRSAQLDKYSKQVPNDEIAAANMYNDDFLLAGADMGLAKSQLAAAETEYKTKPTTELAANIASRRRGIAAASKVHGSGSVASRTAFLDALTKSGYKIAHGKEGYDQLTAMVESISAGDAGARTQLMNGSQFNLKNAGRFDLAGINNGNGYDFELGMSKANGYSAGQSKKESFIAGAAHYLDSTAVKDGKTLEPALLADIVRTKVALNPTNATKIGKWHAQLLEDQQSATGANKDEITKQLDAINQSLTPSSVVDPNTGNPVEPSPGENALAQIVRSNYEQYRRNSVDPNILNETK